MDPRVHLAGRAMYVLPRLPVVCGQTKVEGGGSVRVWLLLWLYSALFTYVRAIVLVFTIVVNEAQVKALVQTAVRLYQTHRKLPTELAS
jgi:hypothetical protein